MKKPKAKLLSHSKRTSHERRKRPKSKPTNPPARKVVAQAPARAVADQLEAPSYKVSWVAINTITVDIANRRPVIPKMVETLVTSIPKAGLRIPLMVRLHNGVTHLVAGLQRLEALKVLKWEEVPCVHVEGDDIVARRAQIIENAERAALTKLERANQTAELIELNESLEQISAEKVQKREADRRAATRRRHAPWRFAARVRTRSARTSRRTARLLPSILVCRKRSSKPGSIMIPRSLTRSPIRKLGRLNLPRLWN
jgi:hypothetical protein